MILCHGKKIYLVIDLFSRDRSGSVFADTDRDRNDADVDDDADDDTDDDDDGNDDQ